MRKILFLSVIIAATLLWADLGSFSLPSTRAISFEFLPVKRNDSSASSLHVPSLRVSSLLQRDLNLPQPPPSLILLRSVGNSLPPRHDPEQTINNLNFTLYHEPSYPHVKSYWVLNRLVDPDLEVRLVALLESFNQSYTVVPFDLQEYDSIPYDFHLLYALKAFKETKKKKVADPIHPPAKNAEDAIMSSKNLYVTNQNAVRNKMVDIGVESGADWILPWDGNCFLHPNALEELTWKLFEANNGAEAQADADLQRYFQIPMRRGETNEEVLDPDYHPRAEEEPQVILHRSAQARFNPRLRYGRQNKGEFLQRIKEKSGYKKLWDAKLLEPYMVKIPDLKAPAPMIGWTNRLSSGRAHLETEDALKDRIHARETGLQLLFSRLDERAAIELHGYDSANLLFFDERSLEIDRVLFRSLDPSIQPTRIHLLKAAKAAVVTGASAPTRNSTKVLQSFIAMTRNATVLALSFYLTGEKEYGEAAARNIRTWLLDNTSKMRAKSTTFERLLRNNDLYHFLDAIRIVEKGDFLPDEAKLKLREWFGGFLAWLESSKVAQADFTSSKHLRGIWYDIQATAITSFLGETVRTLWYIDRFRARILALGSQAQSSRTTATQSCEQQESHLYVLQGVSIMARMASTAGRDFWGYHPVQNISTLCRVAAYSIPFFSEQVPCSTGQSRALDLSQWWPLVHDSRRFCPHLSNSKVAITPWYHNRSLLPPENVHDMPPVYDYQDGIAPFWNLGLPGSLKQAKSVKDEI